MGVLTQKVRKHTTSHALSTRLVCRPGWIEPRHIHVFGGGFSRTSKMRNATFIPALLASVCDANARRNLAFAMASPERRRSLRYSVQLPVSITMAKARVSIAARSENMSLHGILFVSDVLISEGYVVELQIQAGSNFLLPSRRAWSDSPRGPASFCKVCYGCRL
jgi:hypothetical protein